MQSMISRVVSICLCFLGCSALGDALLGKMVKVAGGDTITILAGAAQLVAIATAGTRSSAPETDAPTQYKIRLQGIDAPEKGQAEAEAKAARRGLWQDKNPIEPHEFRKMK